MVDSYVRDKLAKQRSRLIAISVATFLYMIAGITLETVSILGNVFDIERPWFVGVGLGIGLFYWLIRYLHYFRESKYGEPLIAHEREFKKVIRPHIAKAARSRADFKVGLMLEPSADEEKINRIDAEVNDVTWVLKSRCEVAATIILEFEGESKTHTYESNVRLEGRELRAVKFRTLFRVATRTPYFMEHILPLVLAAVPIVLFVYRLARST